MKRTFEHALFPMILAVLAILLCLPGLDLGWVLDDQVHRVALTGPEELPAMARSPVDLFAFVGPHWSTHPGSVPWWARDDFRFAFLRPLTGLTHDLDHRLWPEEPRWMHLHSFFWFALVILAAARVYRRLAPPGELWIAGLAALLFAVDDSHGTPVIWIAHRNAVLAMFFGLLSLLAYHRWRREGWRPGSWLAPLFLLLGVLSGEAAVACGAYLLAYALFLDQGPLKDRLLALLPCATVGVLWRLAYRALGYGAGGSSMYVDPGSEPLRFLAFAWERAPLLLWGQFSFPPADIYNLLSQEAAQGFHRLAVVSILVFGALLVPVLRRDRLARFWACGTLLAVLPACAVTPSQRLLFYMSLGGAGLMAIFLARAWGRADGFPVVWRVTARVASIPLLLIHLLLGPWGLWSTTDSWRQLGSNFQKASASLPSEPGIEDQWAVVVNAPAAYFVISAPFDQVLDGQRIPRGTLPLATSLYGMEVERMGPKSLTIRPEGGFLLPPGTAPPGVEPETFDIDYSLQGMDQLFTTGRPFEVGDRFERVGMTAEVVRLTDDGRPAEVIFHFETALEEASWHWLHWQEGAFAPWPIPSIGETVHLPAPTW